MREQSSGWITWSLSRLRVLHVEPVKDIKGKLGLRDREAKLSSSDLDAQKIM